MNLLLTGILPDQKILNCPIKITLFAKSHPLCKVNFQSHASFLTQKQKIYKLGAHFHPVHSAASVFGILIAHTRINYV